MAFELREALNTISDVVQNRPPPLREFDQIYMKVGDLALQADFIAKRLDGKSVVFVGDGDGVCLSIAHLMGQKIIDYGPATMEVLDFDERIVKSIIRFVDKYRYQDIAARLYNVADVVPENLIGSKDAFYTNPPWGASNDGESILAFVERGIECTNDEALGVVVIADHPSYLWTQQVLRSVQLRVLEAGFNIAEMDPQAHVYHLDDAPDLRSCSLIFRRVEPAAKPVRSLPLNASRLNNFYGRNNPMRYRYVRERASLNYGRAADALYELVPLETK